MGLGLVLALSSCGAASNGEEDKAAENRAYMSQVSNIMDKLTTELEDFNEAVAQDDFVTMRTQAEGASKVLDEFDKLEVPDGLKDIHSEYLSGGNDLRDALSDYIELSAEIEAATEEQPYDFKNYSSDLKEIQKKYDSGIDHLKEADKKATEMP